MTPFLSHLVAFLGGAIAVNAIWLFLSDPKSTNKPDKESQA